MTPVAAAAAPLAHPAASLGAVAANAASAFAGDTDAPHSANADAIARGGTEVPSNAATATAAGQGATVVEATFAAVTARPTLAGLPPPFVSLLLGVALLSSVPLPFALDSGAITADAEEGGAGVTIVDAAAAPSAVAVASLGAA